MKRVLVLLVAGTILSGAAAVFATANARAVAADAKPVPAADPAAR
ncbi:hypothetical protein [Sphingomonas sp. LT1P40]